MKLFERFKLCVVSLYKGQNHKPAARGTMMPVQGAVYKPNSARHSICREQAQMNYGRWSYFKCVSTACLDHGVQDMHVACLAAGFFGSVIDSGKTVDKNT
jgi:hypothetical protein